MYAGRDTQAHGELKCGLEGRRVDHFFCGPPTLPPLDEWEGVPTTLRPMAAAASCGSGALFLMHRLPAGHASCRSPTEAALRGPCIWSGTSIFFFFFFFFIKKKQNFYHARRARARTLPAHDGVPVRAPLSGAPSMGERTLIRATPAIIGDERAASNALFRHRPSPPASVFSSPPFRRLPRPPGRAEEGGGRGEPNLQFNMEEIICHLTCGGAGVHKIFFLRRP